MWDDLHDWWHATLTFPGDTLTTDRAAVLAAALAGQRFHFLRKEGGLRLRTSRPIPHLLDRMVTDQVASAWVGLVYEPETAAFGGPEGLAIAHEAFVVDSPAALAGTGSPHAKEQAILLLSAMYRAAGLDPFEIGDVWARLAVRRPSITPPASPETAIMAMRRLIQVDAAQRSDAEPGWAERVAAFTWAGRRLAQVNREGRLERGLRSVLAHHAVFTFNRAGTPPLVQAAVAWLGRAAAFDDLPETDLNEMETIIDASAEDLRATMVERLITSRNLHTPEIIEVFRTVERHRFLPGTDLSAAYIDDAVPIKHTSGGEMISCISAPSVVATQLEQVGAQPGHKILEGGAATGYNADLLGRLVGPDGHVWSIDVDADLVQTASANLAHGNAKNVTVLLGDAAAGLPDHAPYDRIQLTVGSGEVPPALLEQLTPGGRLVIPMRIRGSISRSFAFERDGETWQSVSCEMATFVPLRKGICDDVHTLVHHQGGGNVALETFSEQQVDREAMTTILDTPAGTVFTGVKFRQGDPWEWVYLWLACVLPNGLSRMPGRRDGFTPHFTWGSMAALDGSSLAYLTVREGADDAGRYWEIGVIGHGPDARTLADQVTTAISEWSHHHGNSAPAPSYRMATAARRGLLTATDPRFVIDKPLSRLVVDWW